MSKSNPSKMELAALLRDALGSMTYNWGQWSTKADARRYERQFAAKVHACEAVEQRYVSKGCGACRLGWEGKDRDES